MSKRTKIALLAGLALIVTPVGVAASEHTGRVDTGASPSDAPVPRGYSGINDPKLLACMAAQRVCAPTVGRQKAEVTARAAIHAPDRASTHSALMTGLAAERRFGLDRSTNVDESRLVWIVTVQARVLTDGGPGAAPEAKNFYSAVIDAGSGLITDDCIGCNCLTASG